VTKMSGTFLNSGACDAGPKGEGRDSPSIAGKYRAYPEYKDSGVEWLSEVPVNWAVLPVKISSSIFNGATPKSGESTYWDGVISWVTPADLGKTNSPYIKAGLRSITFDGYESCGTSLVPAGTVILSSRAPIGTLGISSQELCTNQGCKSLVVKDNCNAVFLYYVLLSSTKQLNMLGRGSTFLEISSDELGAYKIGLPPVTEQIAIANFLDHETDKIDTLIDKQQQLIHLLKEKRQAVISHAVTKGLDPNVPMKDSGVKWLGEVPEHWIVTKFGRLAFMQEGPGLRTWQFTGSGTRVICVTNITEHGIDFSKLEKFISRSEYSSGYRRFTVRKGDILLSSSGNSWGKVAIYSDEEEVILNTSTIRLNELTSCPLTRDFIALFLESVVCKEQLGLAMTGACQPNFGPSHLKEVVCPVPSLEEQRKIVSKFKRENDLFTNAIEAASKVIQLLLERRTALISAAVTGKIDVRHWQPSDSQARSLTASCLPRHSDLPVQHMETPA
jgi:type I restriction enzyme S subunit